MSIAARTETAEQRGAIYRALGQRNRLVRVLRIGFPALAAIVLLGLMLQIYASSLIPEFSFANIAIDRDNLVVEAPVYSGAGGDGAVYTVSAAAARTTFANTDLIDLTDAMFSLRQPGGAVFEARGASARLHISEQLVVVDGVAHIEGTDGLRGTVLDAEVDVGAETMLSRGRVDLTLRDANVKAATMSYDGATGRWTFNRATVLLNSTPGESVGGARPANGSPPVGERTP